MIKELKQDSKFRKNHCDSEKITRGLKMNDVEKALKIAKKAHAGQIDKAGYEYINHPIHVADSLNTEEENPLARKVKIADLKHNSDLTRLKKITEKDIARVEKYQKCLNYLLEVEKQSSVK